MILVPSTKGLRRKKMLEPTFDIKTAFFNSQAVRDAVDEGTRRAMTKSLALYRRRLISLYRRGKGPSSPGNVPHVHSKNRYANLRNVLFGYDHRTKSGVAGPIRLQQSKNAVPGILEAGGTVNYPAMTTNAGNAIKARSIRIQARPSVSVALKASIRSGEIVSPFSNVITGK